VFALQEAEWIDSTSLAKKTEDVDKVVEDYRSLYSATEVESSSEARKVYDAVEQLYVVGEAAKLVELYADHMTELVRHHMDLTGFLGSTCKCPTCHLPLTFDFAVGKNGASNV
jgi:putative NADH-flavin reductase